MDGPLGARVLRQLFSPAVSWMPWRFLRCSTQLGMSGLTRPHLCPRVMVKVRAMARVRVKVKCAWRL